MIFVVMESQQSASLHLIRIGEEQIPIFKKKEFMMTLGFMIPLMNSIEKKAQIYLE